MSSVRRLALVGAVTICAPAFAAAQGMTIPEGTSAELVLQDGLSTRSAKVGDTFRTTVVPAIDIDGQSVLPEGTVVVGKVELVKSIRHGHVTGVIGGSSRTSSSLAPKSRVLRASWNSPSRWRSCRRRSGPPPTRRCGTSTSRRPR
jgi:hypothetical protein